MTPRSLIHRRENSAVDFLTGGDSYPVASGFLGRYHHQIIVCIYFNGRFLNRRKVANHNENTEKKPTRRWANMSTSTGNSGVWLWRSLRRMVNLNTRCHTLAGRKPSHTYRLFSDNHNIQADCLNKTFFSRPARSSLQSACMLRRGCLPLGISPALPHSFKTQCKATSA